MLAAQIGWKQTRGLIHVHKKEEGENDPLAGPATADAGPPDATGSHPPQTRVTVAPAARRAATSERSAPVSLITSCTASRPQMRANAIWPILELSATTTTPRARAISARFVWASTSWWGVWPAPTGNASPP